MHALDRLIGEAVQEVVLLLNDAGQAQQRRNRIALQRGVEGGEGKLPESIAKKRAGSIGGILPERGGSGQAGFSQVEEGPANGQGSMERYLGHAGETGQTRSAQQVQEDGFRLIIRMVPQEQARGIMLGSAGLEETVASLASGGFERKVIPLRFGGHIDSCHFADGSVIPG